MTRRDNMRRRYAFLTLVMILLIVLALGVVMPVSADPGGGAGKGGKVNPIPRPPATSISLGPAWYVYYPMGLKPTADVLGMTPEDLSNYLWAGATLAELAESRGIDLQILRDAVDGAMFRLSQGYVTPSPWQADGKAMPVPQAKFVPGGDGHHKHPERKPEERHDPPGPEPCKQPCDKGDEEPDDKPCKEPCDKPCDDPCKDPCDEPCKDPCEDCCTPSICEKCEALRAVARGGLRLRVGPGVTFMVSRVVAYGTKLTATGETKRVGTVEWCQVCYQGKKLWAASHFLEPW
jgi:hypothetical protein